MSLKSHLLTKGVIRNLRVAVDTLDLLARRGGNRKNRPVIATFQQEGPEHQPEHISEVRVNVPTILSKSIDQSVFVGVGRAPRKAFAKSLATLEAVHLLGESMKWTTKGGGLAQLLENIEDQQEQCETVERELDEVGRALLSLLTPVENETDGVSFATIPVDESFEQQLPATRKGRLDFSHLLMGNAVAAAKALTLQSSSSLPQVTVNGRHVEISVDENVVLGMNGEEKGALSVISALKGDTYPSCITDPTRSFGMAKLFTKLPAHHYNAIKELLSSLAPPDHSSLSTKIRPGWSRRKRRRKSVHVENDESYAKRLASFRSHQEVLSLPVDSVEDKIPHDAPITVVRGGTGSGKTTRYPLMLSLLSPSGPSTNVLVAQPRRLACQTAAHRVAFEQDFKIGEEDCPIGYAVRFDSLPATAETRTVNFQTPGVILRRAANDPLMSDVTHLVIDEVHERNADMDLLLALAKDIMKQRANHPTLPPLRLVLMSATVDASHWESYFQDCAKREFREGDIVHVVRGKQASRGLATVIDCTNKSLRVHFDGEKDSKLVRKSSVILVETDGDNVEDRLSETPVKVVDVPNVRRYPIDIVHLDNDAFPLKKVRQKLLDIDVKLRDDFLWEVTATLAAHIFKNEMHQNEGSILCFLPGMEEIEKVERMIKDCFGRKDDEDSDIAIAKLHSSLTSTEQSKAFKPGPKIILSTNIAETSVTIPDVKVVIDPGRERQFSLLESKAEDISVVGSQLVTGNISRASASQRAGRAGRVSSGTCYRLYTEEDFDEKFEEFTTPEMLRMDLSSLILHSLSVYHPQNGHSLRILRNTPDPPIELRLSQALRGLEQSRLLQIDRRDEENVKLTSLGSVVADLPTYPRIGRMLIMGLALRAIDPALTLAALLSVPRAHSVACRSYKWKLAKLEDDHEYSSDLVKLMDIYNEWLMMSHYDQWRHRASVEFEQVSRVKYQLECAMQTFLRYKNMSESLDEWNTNSNRLAATAALICVATPHIAHLVTGKTSFATRDVAGLAMIHPWSVNASNKRRTHWYLYDSLRTTKKHYLHMTTAVSPLELALFSEASDLTLVDDEEEDENVLDGFEWSYIADQWVPVQISESNQTESFVQLQQLLTNDMLQHLADDPQSVLENSSYHRIVLHVLAAIEQQRKWRDTKTD